MAISTNQEARQANAWSNILESIESTLSLAQSGATARESTLRSLLQTASNSSQLDSARAAYFYRIDSRREKWQQNLTNIEAHAATADQSLKMAEQSISAWLNGLQQTTARFGNLDQDRPAKIH